MNVPLCFQYSAAGITLAATQVINVYIENHVESELINQYLADLAKQNHKDLYIIISAQL